MNEEIELLPKGKVPSGYVWHHHQAPGILQFVKKEMHEAVNPHTGGRKIWGGNKR